VDHEDAALIGDYVHSAEGIPDELAEHHVLIIMAPFCNVGPVTLTKNLLVSSLGDIVCLVDAEAIQNRLGQNAELVVVTRVEFHLHVFFWLARQFGLWHHKLFVLLDVKNGDSEIRRAANHK